jgi:hypothetical protein
MEFGPHKDHRGYDLISDALPFGQLWYAEPDATRNAIDYAKFFSRSHRAVIRVWDEAGNVSPRIGFIWTIGRARIVVFIFEADGQKC